MSMTEEKRQYLFLSEQTLLYNVAVRSRRGGKESLYTLAEAGENWYEVHKEQEMILLGDSVLELAFQPMLGGEAIRAGMRLNDIPKRPEGATRILVELHFSSDLSLLQKFLSEADERKTGDSHAAASARIKRGLADTDPAELADIRSRALELLRAHTTEMEAKYGK